MKKIFAVAVALLFLASCDNKNVCVIDGLLSDPLFEGEQLYILSVDNHEPIDSVVVKDGKFHLECEAEAPMMVQVYADKNEGEFLYHNAAMVLESGNVVLNMDIDSVGGTPLNDAFTKWKADHKVREHNEALNTALSAAYESIETGDKDQEKVVATIDSLMEAMTAFRLKAYGALFDGNKDNVLGLYALQALSYDDDLSADQLKNYIDQGGALVKNDSTLNKKLVFLLNKERTAEGHPVADIDGIDFQNGTATSLKKMIDGKIAVVDFWASWCAPCRAEISETLVPLYEKYASKGLVVVGVDVWDDVDKHREAVGSLGIHYPQLIDTTQTATTLYGISGIPEIMLVSPDGTILKRGLRGVKLEKAVEEALAIKK